MKVIKFTWPYLKIKIWSFCVYIFICLCDAGLAIGIPILSGKIINYFTTEISYELLGKYVILLAIINAVRIILGYLNSMVFAKLQVDLAYLLSSHTIRHVHGVSMRKTDEINPIYLNQRVSQDAGNLISFSISIAAGILTNIFTVIGVLFVAIGISYKITFTFGIFTVLYCISYFLFRKPLYNNSFKVIEAQGFYFSKMSEQFQYIKFVKIHAVNDFFSKRLEESYVSFRKVYIRLQNLSNLFTCTDGVILTLAQVMLYFIGGIEIINGRLSIGMFFSMLNYFPKLTGAVSYFFQLGKKYQNTLAAFDRLNEIFMWEKETGGDSLPEDIKTIQVDNLNFSFGDKIVLKNMNLNFEKGKIYAIIGKNGSGKTTLINALMGLYINEIVGEIKINHKSIKNYNLETVRRKNIGITEQEPTLLNDSILFNLYLGKREKSDRESQILEMLGLDSYINGLSEGVHTVISSKNNNLSGGEKQKISIARVLLKDPEVMFFDEPTSALDQLTTSKLFKYLCRIKSDKIIFIVTHDLTLLSFCDEILKL